MEETQQNNWVKYQIVVQVYASDGGTFFVLTAHIRRQNQCVFISTNNPRFPYILRFFLFASSLLSAQKR